MDVAILCSGPSLRGFLDDPPAHDLLIGVNRAIQTLSCRWWVFNDATAFARFLPREPCWNIFTSKDVRTSCNPTDHLTKSYDWILWENIETDCPDVWKRFSMLSAIVLAVHLGATSIRIYGCDWQGIRDWDGEVGSVRSKDRWTNEQHYYGHVEAWVKSKSVSIERKTNMANPKAPKDKPVPPSVDGSADPPPQIPGQDMPTRAEVEEADAIRAAASEAQVASGPRALVSRLYLRHTQQVGNVQLPAGSPVAEITLPDYGHDINWLGHAIKTDLLTDVEP